MRARRRGALAAVLLAAVLLGGCASAPKTPVSDGNAADPASTRSMRIDPWESWNRKVFGFNEALDVNVLKPVATGYRNVVPGFARTGVSNFFNNVADGWSAINCLLQGRLKDGLDDALRFATNTVFGLGGVLDIAGEMGFEHHYEDFGQTLGKWGAPAGSYIVWPVLGPSSVRDSFALPLDRAASPALATDTTTQAVGVTLLQIVNTRANLLGAGKVLDEIALDKYQFVRDAYLARRRSLVYDGDPPPEDEPPAGKGDGAATPTKPQN